MNERARRGAGFAVVAMAVILLTNGCDRGASPRAVGRLAPAFTIRDGAQTASLAQYRGHVLLLNFWASWCAPCVDEIPSLMALHRQLPRLDILAVSIDDDPAAYERFLAQYRVDFPTIRDPSASVMHRYGTAQIPETYLIDRQGHIVRKYISAQDWTSPEIEQALRGMLAQP